MSPKPQENREPEAPRESQGQLAALFDAIPTGLLLIDPGTRAIRQVNAAAARMIGLPARDIVGKICRQFLCPAETDGCPVCDRGQTLDCSERVLLASGGREIPILKTVVPFALDGKPLLLESFIDIAERKRTEDALRESEAKYRLFFECAADAIFIHEESGRILAANPAACEQLGYELAEVLAMTAAQIDSPADAARVPERIAALVAQGHLEFETAHRRKDGSAFPVEVKARLITWNGRSAVLSVCRDIAERKRAEEAERRNQSCLSAIVENQPGLLWLKDADSRFLAVNAEFAKACGLGDPARLAGKSDLDIWPPKLAAQYMADDARVMQSKKPFMAEEPISDKGEIKWFETFKTPILDKAGVVIGTTGYSRDITARKQAEQEKAKLEADLQQARKMESIGRLAGGVAHDFNNMLTVILGNAELALDALDPAQSVHADLVEIRKAAERSANLTRQLLAFARKQTIAPRVLDLNETIAGMLQMLHRLIGENISIDWRPAADLGPIRVDPAQIDQILANLCVNARDAIAGNGTIAIETANASFAERDVADHEGCAPGEYIVLSVRDTGCGMDAETLSHLFEPFFTSKGFGKGTGLGLATIYGIVKQNNGFILADSRPGAGTTFRVHLPRHANREEPPQKRVPEKTAARGEATILLVEDEPTILNLTARMIEQQGYTVLAANSPEEAVGLAKSHAGPIHLLMTDVVMPEMNGRNLSRILLSLHPEIRCLFMSGYPADVIARHGVLESGAFFIQKPFAKQMLAAKLREALESGRPARD